MISRRMKKTPTGISPIIVIDRRASKALHRQVYGAYRAAIVDRSPRAGQRVPSTRVLASDLGESRIPVLTAYSQLVAEGYFESRVGAGTVVSRSLPDQITFREPPGAQSKRVQAGVRRLSKRYSKVSPVERVPWRRGWGAFGVSQVPIGHFPFQVGDLRTTAKSTNADSSPLLSENPKWTAAARRVELASIGRFDGSCLKVQNRKLTPD
jgi:GntR family transcriptional regulator / MocR family aminotransferase